VPDPLTAAARRILEGSMGALRESVEGLEPDALNWRPAEDTNTLAILITHAGNSTRWWLSLAMGRPLPERDRASEFLASSSSSVDLLTWFDDVAEQSRALLDQRTPFDGAAIRERPRTSTDAPPPVTAAWAMLHALTHLREHVAHAQMTRQLWDQRPA
jgi:hypothetical protein